MATLKNPEIISNTIGPLAAMYKSKMKIKKSARLIRHVKSPKSLFVVKNSANDSKKDSK